MRLLYDHITCFLPLPQTISIPEGELMNHSKDLDLSSVIQEAEFEGIINRNSTKYIELYNIPEVHSILRGSIRYKVQFFEESKMLAFM